ncbi:MAG: CBU_0592 family membrane protein [Steroidobacteraceae bacterium]
MKLAVEVIGWIAAVLIVAAYALLSAGRFTAESKWYHLMNILGAIGFVVNSGWNGAFPSAALNVVWLGIGSYALLQHRKRQIKGSAPVH